mmetsp:Transcript_93707/g.242582  ORF Transcript_93707/g.242582 Transcript_93707/m.242582 type:complete len:229 (+) Transcript_93707:1696-2382(+)
MVCNGATSSSTASNGCTAGAPDTTSPLELMSASGRWSAGAPSLCNSASAQATVALKRAIKFATTALYGSDASSAPGSARTAGVHSCTLSDQRKVLNSRKYKRAAWRRCMATTSRVIFEVTLGLPSRSPPIQDAKTIGVASKGKRCWHFAPNTESNRRKKPGTASHKDVCTTARPSLASSWGVGLLRRKTSEPNIADTARRIARSFCIFSKVVAVPPCIASRFASNSLT